MRVALVSFAFGEYSIRLASALSEHADVGLWLTNEQAAPHLGRLDPRVDFRPFHKPRMRQPVQQIPAMGRLIRQIRQFQPDIVHIQQGYLWFNPLLVFLRGFPSITTIHDPLPHLGDRLGKKTPQAIADMVYRGSSAVIVHNDEMRDVVADRAVIRDIHVVPHPILGDVEIFGDVTEDGATVLFFGRIWPYKGLEYLIQAEPLIAAQVPDVRIIIAGAGEDFSRYRDLMVHPDRFEVHNQFIPSGTTAELFRRSSVVALPYVDATQSGVIPMAYNFAKPVVATTVGGLPSMVDDGETGYLVAPRDVPALAEAIVRILKNPGLGAELGARGKHKVETDFSAEAVAAQTMAVYRDVAENG